ncbi:MAG: hypothetical protein ACETWD_03595 [Desulfatiglandales bacterium]
MLRKLAGKASRLEEKGWKATVDLSLDSSTGNTDEQAMRFGSHIKRELPDRRGALDMSFYHKVKEGEVWTVLKYILHPFHVSVLQCRDWAEQRNNVLESAVDVYKRNKALPIS